MAVFICGKCGHETEDVRCCPKVCPKCGAPREALKKE
ncbi:MAG TPA: rubredoxin [bacterium]|nr:rubredoxin [bacterium]